MIRGSIVYIARPSFSRIVTGRLMGFEAMQNVIKVFLAAAGSAGYQVIINCLILFRNGIFYRKDKELEKEYVFKYRAYFLNNLLINLL